MKKIVGKIFALSLMLNAFSIDNEMVTHMCYLTKKIVTDVNDDNKINCIDYTVTFKKLWDKYCKPGHTMNCEIVRNVNNRTNFNHLFIRVRENSNSDWLYIEPQASSINFMMEEHWKERYDPRFNIYGETYIWLMLSR